MEEQRTAQIDAYLTDSMSSDEKKAFELALENDPELKAEFNLQKKTTALLEAAAFLATKNKISAINQQKSFGSTLGGNLLKVAAVFLILMIPTYFILNNHFNDEHLFADYAEPYPDRITTMGASDETKLTEAISAYKKQEYASAAKLFASIRLEGSENESIVLYEAVSLTYSNQAKNAIDLLETAIIEEPSNVISLEWQLILSLLANGQGDDAKEVLDEFLDHNNGYQQEKAEALQTDLNRIWR